MINRYGEEIEADLFDRGWDLLDFFRGARPWGQLMRLVDHMPAWSRTGRAMADDDDLHAYRQRRLVEAGVKARRPPRLTEWTEFDELIQTMQDIGTSIRVTIAQSVTPKGKPAPSFKPGRRPMTAGDRAEKRADRETVQDIIALALPNGPESTG